MHTCSEVFFFCITVHTVAYFASEDTTVSYVTWLVEGRFQVQVQVLLVERYL
jgi:hypothetical protein